MTNSRADKFWDLIESKMNCEVPQYLRKLLNEFGFNNVVSVKELEEEDMLSIENYAQHKESMMSELTDLIPSITQGTNFQIPIGTKKMLRQIVIYIKEKWTSEGPSFFNFEKSCDIQANVGPKIFIPDLPRNRRKRNSKGQTISLKANNKVSQHGARYENIKQFENLQRVHHDNKTIQQNGIQSTESGEARHGENENQVNNADNQFGVRPLQTIDGSMEHNKENRDGTFSVEPEVSSVRYENIKQLAHHKNKTKQQNDIQFTASGDGDENQLNNAGNQLGVGALQSIDHNKENRECVFSADDIISDHSDGDLSASDSDDDCNHMLDQMDDEFRESLAYYKDTQIDILLSRVKNWILTFDEKLYKQHYHKIQLNMLTPKIRIKDNKIKLTAKIQCILCDSNINATMSSKTLKNKVAARGEERGPSTWTISNYERHIKREHYGIKKVSKDNSNFVANVSDFERFAAALPKRKKTNVIVEDSDEDLSEVNFSVDHEKFHQVVSSLVHSQSEMSDMESLSGHLNEINKIDELKNKIFETLSLPANRMLQELVYTAVDNASKKNENGYRFGDVIKKFACYIKLLGGKLLYETIHANLSMAIPSLSTVNRFSVAEGPQIIEGVLRSEELKSYLEERKLPLIVWVAEDATRNVGKVCYDPATNQLVGFVPALNEHGMPIVNAFPARHAKEIEDHFDRNVISTMAYTITAQPLVEHVPPFVLTVFSTDNKFQYWHVSKRWRFISNELKKQSVLVAGFSSDGDCKCLKAMKIESGLGMRETTCGDFSCEWLSFGKFSDLHKSVFIQDINHVLTKLRGTLLTVSRIFPFGDKLVSNTHLKLLLQQVSKDNHLLTNTDIQPKDKMNSKSAEKICNPLVQECLKKHIPGSEATVLFLKMMNFATSSFLDPDMPISQRIKKIWYSVFVLRIWRSWLSSIAKESKNENKNKNKKRNTENDEVKFSLRENFISSNAYNCIELNAHSLIQYIIRLRMSNQPELFLPTLLGSQSCESTFRQLRSLTTTSSTVVNFTITMYDMLHRLRKIQLQSDIIANSPEIKFPRLEKKMNAKNPEKKPLTVFPSNEQIVSLISEAKDEAIADSKKLGINMDKIDFYCQVKPISEDNEGDQEIDEDEEWDMEREVLLESQSSEMEDEAAQAEIERDVRVLKNITGPLIMKDYTATNVIDEIDEESPYCVVLDGTGKEYIVRKSSICWLLTQNKHSLSSDRLVRVRECELIKQQKFKFQISANKDSFVEKRQEIHIGEWCIFTVGKCLLIGQVLSFSYLKGKTHRTREYSRPFATIENAEKAVGALCHYYSWDLDGTLNHQNKYQFYIDVNNYEANIPAPEYNTNSLRLKADSVKQITDFLHERKNRASLAELSIDANTESLDRN